MRITTIMRLFLSSSCLFVLGVLQTNVHATTEIANAEIPANKIRAGDSTVQQQEQQKEQPQHDDSTFHQWSRLLSSGNGNPYASSDLTYDGYQQAWRLLGFYVDCNQGDVVDEEEGDEHRRKLGGDNDNSFATCQRYLIWGAYVDMDYMDDGVGEYKFWDPSTQKWDDTTCQVHGNGKRCAKMDCHESSTHWKLLGIYKEAFYSSEWFEQLFKHAGYCLWDYNLYYWMQTYYASWPEYCTETNKETSSGKLYVDLKPSAGGNMTLALYTDNACKTEYTGNDVSVDSIVEDLGFLSGHDSAKFNDAMQAFKYCQPCRAANRGNLDNSGNSYNNNKNNRRYNDRDLTTQGLDDDLEDPNEGYFACYDDAGYTNVNQCMKFRTHTFLQAATRRDLEAATLQGGMLQIEVDGITYGNGKPTQVNGNTIVEQSYKVDTSSVQGHVGIVNGYAAVNVGIAVLVVGMLSLAVSVWWVRQRKLGRNAKKSSKLGTPLIMA